MSDERLRQLTDRLDELRPGDAEAAIAAILERDAVHDSMLDRRWIDALDLLERAKNALRGRSSLRAEQVSQWIDTWLRYGRRPGG